MAVFIIYHSQYGHTRTLANEVRNGSEQEGLVTSMFDIGQLQSDSDFERLCQDAAEADTIVFGCPTYMAGPSAQFKEFMDRTSRIWYGQGWRDKLAAGFTCSGNPSGDKLNTLQSLSLFAAQHSMIWINQGHIAGPGGEGRQQDGINRAGFFLGCGAQAGQVPPDQEPGEADRATARAFGRRIARITRRWRAAANINH
jgi:NAD(P)H dehydrogenase (quinone)